MSPLEKNGRQLIGVMVRCFPLGGTTEELRREFEKATFLRRQSFYETLRYCKQQGWLTGGGSPTRHGVSYQLDPAGSWKPPSAGESAGEPPLSRDQLEFLADSQAQQLAELRNQIEYLRDWSSGICCRLWRCSRSAANVLTGASAKWTPLSIRRPGEAVPRRLWP